MRLPVEWIREYAPVKAGAEELARTLTMAGLEVEETTESELGPVLDVTVTPNRGDCLSVIGVAREVAAAYSAELAQAPFVASLDEGQVPEFTSVVIEDPDLCPRYAARIIRNVLPAPSPEWIQARLAAAGMRPVGGIVDITNYVMLEMGQPLHAFDYDKLSENRIVVRRARRGEKVTTLDGAERELTPEMLAICDAVRPVAVAGVMGGADTEVTEGTRNVLLESAHFHPLSVRRTARALSLRTEASHRFERVVDPAGVVSAADRACSLIHTLGLGEVVPGVVDVYPDPIPLRSLTLRPERVSELLGITVEAATAMDCLARLGFSVLEADGALAVGVPTWRPDVVREIDLVEEVGRVLGYEKLPERLPAGTTHQGGDSEWGRFTTSVRDVMVGFGLQEVVSHSLLAVSPFEDPRDAARRVAVRSALSAELSGLRRSLIPGLMAALDRNARRGQGPLAFFEIGHIFHAEGDAYLETSSVAAALCGEIAPRGWQHESGREADFYLARGIVESVCEALRVQDVTFDRSDDPRLHPGRAARVLVNGHPAGFVGELHPDLARDLHVRSRVVTLALSLEPLKVAAAQRPPFQPLTPYPAVTRDLAPRVPEELPFGRVRATIQSATLPILESVDLTDVYTGRPLPEGVKSLTLTFTFRSPERTLTDEEVNAALDRFRSALETACGATFPA